MKTNYDPAFPGALAFSTLGHRLSNQVSFLCKTEMKFLRTWYLIITGAAGQDLIYALSMKYITRTLLSVSSVIASSGRCMTDEWNAYKGLRPIRGPDHHSQEEFGWPRHRAVDGVVASPPLKIFPLITSGSPANRVDLVFFSDGCELFECNLRPPILITGINIDS